MHPRPRSTPLALGLALLGATQLGCRAPRVDAMPRLGWLRLEGDFAAGVGGPGQPNQLEALGLGDREASLMPRVDWTSGRWDHTVDWVGAQYAGSGEVQNDFTLDGVTFPQGTAVVSDLEFGVARWLATYDLLDHRRWVLGLGGGVGLYAVETRLLDPVSTAQTDTDQLGLAPNLALRAGYDWGSVDVGLLIGWLGFSLNDTDVQYLDLDLGLRWFLRGPEQGWSSALVAGLRWVDLEASYREEGSDERIDWNTRVAGPYLGFSLGF